MSGGRALRALAFHARAMLGDADARHRVAARVRAELRLRRWRGRFRAVRRRDPGRPIVVVGLVEHLGDIVAAEPIARQLRAEMPTAHIVWPVRAPFRDLVAHHPAVDETPSLGCLTEWSWMAGRLGADRIVDLHIEGRSCPACRMPHARRDGDRSITIGNYYRHGALLEIFARAAGLRPLDERPQLHIPSRARERVDGLALPPGYVVVHCTSSQAARDWEARKWRELAAIVAGELGATVVEVGLSPVLDPASGGIVSLCGRLSLAETAEVIRRARLFVGVDSGPAHLANAAGTPGVILLGRYRSYERYLPYTGAYADRARADVIHHDGPASDIPVAEVAARVRRRLDARVNGTGSGLVSVVVPTYGHRDYVLASLESVFAQTYREIEVIVVNDGSPDDTAGVLRPLVEAGRIRYVEQANAGQGAARNRGLAEVRGEFVAFLDDDDCWPPDNLARHVAALRGTPEAVLSYADYVRLAPDGTLSEPWTEARPSGDAFDGFRLRNHMISPGQALIRTDAARAVGGFDPEIWGSDDWDFYLRLARRGPFLHEPRVALHYRDHASNASRRAVLHARNHLRVARRHIGWNLPLLARHQRAASGYFVPNLLDFAERARASGAHRDAVGAHLWALVFRPTLLARPAFARSLLGAALSRSRTRDPSTTRAGPGRSRGA